MFSVGVAGTNVGEAGYSAQILEATLHFRKLVKTTLVGNDDLGQFWLMDTLACIGTVPPTMPEKLELLHNCLGPDGIHLTDSGRMHLFNNLAKMILGMKAGTVGKPPKIAEAAACSSVSCRPTTGGDLPLTEALSPARHRPADEEEAMRGRGPTEASRTAVPGRPGEEGEAAVAADAAVEITSHAHFPRILT
jgi:hypothetical protein